MASTRKTTRLLPLLTGISRYEKTVSTANRGTGQFIHAPIIAYLIETPNGRILYDTGCDYRKLATPTARKHYFARFLPVFEAPHMNDTQRIPHYLQRLRLTPQDIDLILLSHLHFDHAGGLHELAGCEVHLHKTELEAALSGTVTGVFPDEITNHANWHLHNKDDELAPGIHTFHTPGHTAGHLSLRVEFAHSRPVILCGDAADLQENLTDEIAPGYCWQDNETLALASIRKLKALAQQTHAELWPNHDLAFFQTLPAFPIWRE